MKSWHVYLIFNENYTYIGATNNLKQRIRKHNGEIKGGAKYTTRKDQVGSMLVMFQDLKIILTHFNLNGHGNISNLEDGFGVDSNS